MLEGAARQALGDINKFFSKERIQRSATEDERVRLARELHDGVLQTLTAACLQLEALSRLIDEDPKAARKRLRDISDVIADQQRELRIWIHRLKPTTGASMASNVDLSAALEPLCQQAESQWGLRVRLTTSRGMIPRGLGDEVYRLVQEALANVTRHARAQCVDVGLAITRDWVHITVTDDGVGFPFHGRYDLAMLVERRLGPRSQVERVASLGGEFVLTSTLSGSKLEMALPLRPQPASGSISGKPRGYRSQSIETDDDHSPRSG
jgi:signal transduction histidine kinase